MKWLCSSRGQKVSEDPRLRLGEVRFKPSRTGEERAEMSSDTWQLIENDESMARTYTIARSRAMRQQQSSMMSLVGNADRSKADALDALEKDVSGLLAALHAINDPSDFASGDLIRRRQMLRKELAVVRSRVDAVGARFEVVDELLGSKVLT